MLKKCERLSLISKQNGTESFHIVPLSCKTCGNCTRKTHAGHCFIYIWLGNLFFCIIIAWQPPTPKSHPCHWSVPGGLLFGLSQTGVFQVNQWPRSNRSSDQLIDFQLACRHFLIPSSSVGGALFLALSLGICKRVKY